tara:strand:+ start:393 stop:674 length:282 start_codon:yes stop_codon:yes gene_type:complete
MDYEVKSIEQENINFSKLFVMTIVLIITVIASTIFVYYWFTFEKMDVMHEQYLGKESKIKKEHDLIEVEKINKLDMLKAKSDLEKKYLIKYGK